MFCNKCGNRLAPESIFCNRCGSRAISDNVPAVPDQYSRADDYDRQQARPMVDARPVAASYGVAEDQVIFTLKPTLVFIWVMYFVAAIAWLAVAAILGLIVGAVSSSSIWSGWGILILLIIGVVLFAFPAYKHILRSREVYTLTNHNLQMRFGLIAKTVRNIPVAKIQDVTVTAAVWQRLLNMGDIEIDSASEGGTIILDNIHYPNRYADMIMAEARRRN